MDTGALNRSIEKIFRYESALESCPIFGLMFVSLLNQIWFCDLEIFVCRSCTKYKNKQSVRSTRCGRGIAALQQCITARRKVANKEDNEKMEEGFLLFI